MIRMDAKGECCGCGACALVCPAGAIAMRADAEGFVYPQVEEERCVCCGACERVCPMRGAQGKSAALQSFESAPPEAFYAARLRDGAELAKSQSGGLFWALAQEVLAEGGVVYGAAYDEDLNVRHVRAQDVQQAEKLRGSKYVQSQTGDTFAQARDDLRSGRRVLYAGTPCQIAALRNFLGELAGNGRLLTCDLVCFGVFSPAVYRAMLQKMGKVRAFVHRDKRFGWRTKTQTYLLEGGKQISNGHLWSLYTQRLAVRPSCDACPFAGAKRPGDVTMGDLWGVEKIYPDLDDGRGVSLALASTPRGRAALEAAAPWLELRPCPRDKALQPCLRAAPGGSRRRGRFWRDFARMPFARVLRRYTPAGGWVYRFKRALRRQARRFVKRFGRALR